MKTAPQQSAFSLVEVTLALGLAGFCLTAVFGLLPVGVNSNRLAIEQTAASNLATRIVADLQATSTTSTASPNFNVAMNGDTTTYLRADGSQSATASDSRYRARVITGAGAGGAHTATTARILITWPAASDPAKVAADRFETVTALNRN